MTAAIVLSKGWYSPAVIGTTYRENVSTRRCRWSQGCGGTRICQSNRKTVGIVVRICTIVNSRYHLEGLYCAVKGWVTCVYRNYASSNGYPEESIQMR